MMARFVEATGDHGCVLRPLNGLHMPAMHSAQGALQAWSLGGRLRRGR